MSLRGDLGELALADLVQMTSMGRKSGRLVVLDEEDAVAGVLGFRAGRLTSARSGGLSGRRAFFALLGVRTGSFDFDPTAAADEEGLELDLSVEPLLIEGARRLDETLRLRESLPSAAALRRVGGEAGDALEARLLDRLTAGAATVGEAAESVLAAGDVDEHDVLAAVSRLRERGAIAVDVARDGGANDPPGGEPPQPELER